MRIRIFRAVTLAEAMAQVRDELGLDALILSTTKLGGAVEVTAALEPEDEPDLPVPPLSVVAEPVGVAPPEPADASLQRHGLPAPILAVLQQGPLEAGCSRLFRFTRLPIDADAPPLLLAGPPGAGKTLTIAKLATRLVMEGHRPLVITSDDQRAGAVEQLAAFTRLLGLTLIAAGRPEMLERALTRREAHSPVLIDAPGLDLLDPAQEDLLASLIAASGARTGLVLPAGLDPGEAVDIAAAHAGQGVELLVGTRLDRSARLGGLLAAAHGAGMALTEAGIGTDLVDGLAPLTPVSIAARLAAPAPVRRAVARSMPPAPPAPAPSPAPLARAALDIAGADTGRSTLALHIAAQAGTGRLPSRKTSS